MVFWSNPKPSVNMTEKHLRIPELDLRGTHPIRVIMMLRTRALHREQQRKAPNKMRYVRDGKIETNTIT